MNLRRTGQMKVVEMFTPGNSPRPPAAATPLALLPGTYALFAESTRVPLLPGETWRVEADFDGWIFAAPEDSIPPILRLRHQLRALRTELAENAMPSHPLIDAAMALCFSGIDNFLATGVGYAYLLVEHRELDRTRAALTARGFPLDERPRSPVRPPTHWRKIAQWNTPSLQWSSVHL